MSDRGLRSRKALALSSIAVVALGLTSCATANPGDAAVVGTTSIPQTTIGEELRSVNEKVGLPPDNPSAEASRALVYGNVVVELVEQTAAKIDVKVPESQVDQYYQQQVQSAGSVEALEQALAQQGIAPQIVRQFVRSNLLQQAIANRLAPGGDQQAQGTALRAIVQQVADEVGVQIAPKYGVWDPQSLQIVDPADPVAKPAAGGVAVPSVAPSP